MRPRECLRTLTYDATSNGGKTLRTHGNFNGNRQIVRCSHYNDTVSAFPWDEREKEKGGGWGLFLSPAKEKKVPVGESVEEEKSPN